MTYTNAWVALDDYDPTQYVSYYWDNDDLVETPHYLQPAGAPPLADDWCADPWGRDLTP